MLRPDSLALTVLLGALAALGPLSMDTYLVSLPTMTEAFGSSVARVQLTLSVFMVGFALGMFIYGPLSDRFGRRPVLLVGLVVYVAASAAAATAASIDVLIVARFFQAVGLCSGPVVGRAVVRDLYVRERAAKVLSYMAVVAGLAPIVAPVIGSYLHVAFGWRANFAMVTVYGAVVLAIVATRFGETHLAVDPGALGLRRIAGNTATLLGSRHFLGYATITAFTGSGLFAFISGSPFVFQQVFGVHPQDFGWLFAFCMAGYLVGSVFGGRVVARVGIDRLLLLGVLCGVLGGGSMALLAWADVHHVAAIMLPMFVFMLAFALVLPQAVAAALTPVPQIAGTASSLIGLFQYGLSAIVGMLVAAFFDGTQRPMASAIGAVGLLAALAYVTLVRRQRI